MRSRLLTIVTVAFAAITACTASRTGAPDPENKPSSSTQTSSVAPSTTARLLPPRPRSLDLSRVDPCMDVLTKPQLRQLAYDLGYQREPQPNTSAIDNARNCTYSSSAPPDQPSRDIGSLIAISLSAGAETWLTDPTRGGSAERARSATIEGFPALVMPHPRIVDNCAVVVDVHDGQYFLVASSPSGGAEGASPEPFCAEAQRVAEMVIQTLSAR